MNNLTASFVVDHTPEKVRRRRQRSQMVGR